MLYNSLFLIYFIHICDFIIVHQSDEVGTCILMMMIFISNGSLVGNLLRVIIRDSLMQKIKYKNKTKNIDL